MGENFFEYIERMELLFFFSGYPLVYSLIYFVHGRAQKNQHPMLMRLVPLLPLAYALSASIFFGFWLREFVIRQQIQNIRADDHISLLKAWGLSAVIFWIPFFNRKPIYSLLHCMVFFIVFLKELLAGIGSEDGGDIIRNDMRIYTISLALNLVCLTLIWILSIIIKKRFPSR